MYIHYFYWKDVGVLGPVALLGSPPMEALFTEGGYPEDTLPLKSHWKAWGSPLRRRVLSLPDPVFFVGPTVTLTILIKIILI